MPEPGHSGDEQPSRGGYIIAVAVSAIAHIGIVIFVLFVMPKLFRSETPPPLSYTVKIVDSIPAGDLGTRLPAINSAPPPPRSEPSPPPERQATKPEKPPPPVKAPPIPPPPDDKNAIALNTLKQSPTPTPPPTPVETPPPTPMPEPSRTPRPRRTPRAHPTRRPTPEATPRATPEATPRPRPHAKPTPRPRPRSTPIALAAIEPTPDVSRELETVKENLRRDYFERLRAAAKAKADAEKNARASANPGSGPVVADRERAGTGMGVGPGTGSAGMLQDPGFVMYYQDVQDRIRRAWSFAGGNPDLSATVKFGINPDGSLNSLKVTESSRDPAFDDSVTRAIRAAAPFGAPPEKYREAFARGVPAVFKLSELQSGTASGD